MGFEVLTAVVMKITIFWDTRITPCSPLSVNRRFGRAYLLHLQGRKNKFSKKPTWKHVASWFLAVLIFSTLKIEAICSSETSVQSTDYKGVISQNIVLFIINICLLYSCQHNTISSRWSLLSGTISFGTCVPSSGPILVTIIVSCTQHK
jgi:hypothetical protein